MRSDRFDTRRRKNVISQQMKIYVPSQLADRCGYEVGTHIYKNASAQYMIVGITILGNFSIHLKNYIDNEYTSVNRDQVTKV